VLVHFMWFAREWAHSASKIFYRQQVAHDLFFFLRLREKKAWMSLVFALMMLLLIGCFNAFYANTPCEDSSSCHILRICFGIGHKDVGIMTFGISGVYWVLVCFFSFFDAMKANHQLSVIYFFRKELFINKDKLGSGYKYWTFVEYCGKISVIKERWCSDEEA